MLSAFFIESIVFWKASTRKRDPFRDYELKSRETAPSTNIVTTLQRGGRLPYGCDANDDQHQENETFEIFIIDVFT